MYVLEPMFVRFDNLGHKIRVTINFRVVVYAMESLIASNDNCTIDVGTNGKFRHLLHLRIHPYLRQILNYLFALIVDDSGFGTA